MVENAPTMLVGVGGTGCEIANRIAGMVKEQGLDRGNRLVILGFDTDDKDMRRCENLGPRRRIRFSSKETVYQLARKLRPGIDSWFVEDADLTTEIRQMSLIDGAGQLRMLTRLGLYNAMFDPQINADIDASVSALAEFGGQTGEFAGNVNVLVVGSLAGATGSGSFLQISLILADRLREKGMQPHVRGLFLLPEVFARAARLPSDQIPNVLANGYASLRELNALILRAAGRTDKDFQFEYAPGKVLKPDGLPLRSVSLIDYENSVGGNLGLDYDAYKDMAVRAAYTLMFTPIGGRISSVTVNDAQAALAAAAAEQSRSYAGVGVSSIRYPQADNLRYLSLRYAQSALDGEWLRLNRMFNAKMERFEERRRQGDLTAEAPQPGPSFVEDLRQLAVMERVPFFRRQHDCVHVRREDDNGRIIAEDLHISFLDGFVNHVLNAFWNHSPDLRQAAKREAVDAAVLADKATLARHVNDAERELDRDWRTVEAAVLDKPDDIYITAFQGGETLTPAEWQPHHLQSYIRKNGWHPIASRYFLYCVRAEIAARREGLNPKERRQAVLNASRIFDEKHNESKDAEPRRASPQVRELAEKAARGGFLGFGRGELNRFAGDYAEYFASSHANIRRFAEQAVLMRVYDRLDRDLEHLVGVFEAFFRDIASMQGKLNEEMSKLSRPNGHPDRSLMVWCDDAARDAMWDELAPHLGSQDDNRKVNDALSSALYERYREERGRKGNARLAPFDGRTLFEEQMVEGHCAHSIRDRFSNVFSMTVVEAIRREAALLDKDWATYFDQLVQTIGYQSQPFLAFQDVNAGQRIMFWAVSPRNSEEIGNEALFAELFSRNQGERPLIAAEFPDTELLCFNARVNLFLTDLRKFHPGDPSDGNISAAQQGLYDQKYRERVARMLEDKRREPGKAARDFTPHLDREWHKPGVLPEIFGDDPAENALHQALVYGFALELLPRREENGLAVTYVTRWEHRGSGGGLERLQVDRHDEDLPAVLRSRPEVTASIHEAAEVLRRRDRQEQLVSNPLDSFFYKGLTAPETLARIVAMTARRGERQDRLAGCLSETLFQSIHDFLVQNLTWVEPWRRSIDACEKVQTLVPAAFALLEQKQLLQPETLVRTREMIDSLARKVQAAWRERAI